MSVYEASITNPKKQLEFYKDLSEQLQQENKQLKEKINIYEDPEDLTLMFMYCEEKAKDKIKELQKEKDTLYNTLIITRTKYNNDKARYRRKAKRYKERINKTIEYIKGAYEMALYTNIVCLDEDNIEDLLEILKGGNNGKTK